MEHQISHGHDKELAQDRTGNTPIGQGSAAGRFVFAFADGFLMLLGARIADGCTSGHGKLTLDAVLGLPRTLREVVDTSLYGNIHLITLWE